MCSLDFFFFFQAEDGKRDYKVTGVQTCALPIYTPVADRREELVAPRSVRAGHGEVLARGRARLGGAHGPQIGRASCRGRDVGVGLAGCMKWVSDVTSTVRTLHETYDLHTMS